jgi:hypothetical protein
MLTGRIRIIGSTVDFLGIRQALLIGLGFLFIGRLSLGVSIVVGNPWEGDSAYSISYIAINILKGGYPNR